MASRRKRSAATPPPSPLLPDPVAAYQAFMAEIARAVTRWVPEIRRLHAGLELVLPPEKYRLPLLNAEDPAASSAALELWGWTGTLQEELMTVLLKAELMVSLTDADPRPALCDATLRGEEEDRRWRELDPGAPPLRAK